MVTPTNPLPWQRLAAITGGFVALAVVSGTAGFVGYPLLRGLLQPASAAEQCARPAPLTPTLFSDDRWTTIQLSSPDLSNPQVLRAEPSRTLPGMFSTLLALSSDAKRLAYVTANDELMDDAHIWSLDVGHPEVPHAVAAVPRGLTPVRPAWSADGSRLAFVIGRPAEGLKAAHFELWEARADALAPPVKRADVAPSTFGTGQPMSLCWTASDQIGALAVAPPPNGPPTPAASPARPRGSSCGVPVFSQNDPAWREQIMQDGGDAIGAYGCALTSTAMLLNYYGATLTPAQLNACLAGGADPIIWASAPNCANGRARGGERADFSWQGLDAILSRGRPAIVGMVGGRTGMHFVVVTGGGSAMADGYRITDPWDGTITKTLGSYTSTGSNLRWIITYDGEGRNCARLTSGQSPVQGFTDGGTYRTGVTLSVPGKDVASAEVYKMAQVQSADGGPPALSLGTGLAKATPEPSPTVVPQPDIARGWKKPIKGQVSIDEDGIYRVLIHWRAHHVPAVTQMKFTIDRTPPSVGLTLLNPIDSSQSGAAIPRLSRPGELRINSSDKLTGVQLIEYSLDGGNWTPYSDDVSFSRVLRVQGLGYHIISYRALDVAGNVSETRDQAFRVINVAAPEQTITPPPIGPSLPSGPGPSAGPSRSQSPSFSPTVSPTACPAASASIKVTGYDWRSNTATGQWSVTGGCPDYVVGITGQGFNCSGNCRAVGTAWTVQPVPDTSRPLAGHFSDKVSDHLSADFNGCFFEYTVAIYDAQHQKVGPGASTGIYSPCPG